MLMKKGVSLLLALVTKFHLFNFGACQVKRWAFVKETCFMGKYLHNIYPYTNIHVVF